MQIYDIMESATIRKYKIDICWNRVAEFVDNFN